MGKPSLKLKNQIVLGSFDQEKNSRRNTAVIRSVTKIVRVVFFSRSINPPKVTNCERLAVSPSCFHLREEKTTKSQQRHPHKISQNLKGRRGTTQQQHMIMDKSLAGSKVSHLRKSTTRCGTVAL